MRDVAAFDLKIDADEIARDLNANDPASAAFAAGRKALGLRRAALSARRSLVIETTLSSNELLKFVHSSKAAGYRFGFVYLFISSVDLCDFRVKQRVMRGGHSIPIDVIARRYNRSLQSFDRFLDLADEAWVYDANSEHPRIIATKQDGHVEIRDEFGWGELGIAIAEANQQ